MTNEFQTPGNPAQPAKSQRVPNARSSRERKRVPSVLTPERQREAVGMVRAGRNVHQVAKEFSVSEVVILELWTRDFQRRTNEFLDSLQSQIHALDEDLRGRRAALAAMRRAA